MVTGAGIDRLAWAMKPALVLIALALAACEPRPPVYVAPTPTPFPKTFAWRTVRPSAKPASPTKAPAASPARPKVNLNLSKPRK